MEWYWWLLIFIATIRVFSHYQTKWKRERLMEKYGDESLVDKLMEGEFWQGQPEGQLLDSLGKPKGIYKKVLKTKTKEVWKYNETGNNSYALKITLENGEVVGWDQKLV